MYSAQRHERRVFSHCTKQISWKALMLLSSLSKGNIKQNKQAIYNHQDIHD